MAVTDNARTAASRGLHPGSKGLARGYVTEIQRGRILAAAVQAVEELGYAHLTVAQIIGRARVSRKTFYDVFRDRDDCFLAAFDNVLIHLRERMCDAYLREKGWREGVRSALAQVLIFMDEDPALARLCVIEALGAGEPVLQRRAEMLGELTRIVDRGRLVTASAREPPEVTAEGIVGAIFAVLHARLLGGGREPLTDLLGSLMSMIVLPYLGPSAASRELRGPTLERRERQPSRRIQRHENPLDGLNMRLTYRTVQVLMVIAQHPGASNREVAEGSGIADQGQISKLLARLASLKLIRNTGEGSEKGARNAWHLTPRGAQIERATRTH
jgi:AcrR family transcriptional regulator